MVRRAFALMVLLGVCLGATACGDPGKESSKAPLAEPQAPASTTTPDKAAAGSPGELPPPPGFKKK